MTLIDRQALGLARQLAAWPTIATHLDTGLDLHGYQVESVLKVVNDLHGRAILADEVGLGKTIEAGLVAAELREQKGIENVLILVPAGLQTQWVEELKGKFGWTAQKGPKDPGWLWVLSIDTAKRPPLLLQLQCVQWDLVIVDEAHHLKNPRTQNYQLVCGLKCRYMLLLTATPMENQLTELYSLVNLVKPGLFGPYLRFYRQFILDKRTPKNAAQLRGLLSQVMVRNQRHSVGVEFPAREVTLVPLKLSSAEERLYEALSMSLKNEYRQRVRNDQTVLPLLILQREMCSSPWALLPTLEKSDWIGSDLVDLVALARTVGITAKMRAVRDLACHLHQRMLIFTEYRGTQDALVTFLQDSGFSAAAFHGALRTSERDRLIDWFRQDERILVSTEAGGQGINLQFCHVVVNFDLPWNPMRIEQRIGRVHRIGQTHTVEIYNLFAVDTVEEDILRLLHEKIDLFRTVIGELDVILRHIERRGSLEKRLIDIFFWEDDHDSVVARLEQLGNEFLASRRRLSWPAPTPHSDSTIKSGGVSS